MRNARIPVGAVLVICLAACVGCNSQGGAAGGGGGGDSMISGAMISDLVGEWKLTRMNGKDLELPPDAPGERSRPSLQVQQNGRVGGMAGVNRWSSSLDPASLLNGNFDINPAITTTMMAGSPGAMLLERDFLANLVKVRSFNAGEIPQGVLSLQDDSGAEILRFARASGTP